MNSKQIFSAILFAAIIMIVLYNCKDKGTEPPAQTGLSASSTNVSIGKGSSAQITLSGGITPYSIKRQPDTAKATDSLASSMLTISGRDTGSTSTIIADSKTPVADSIEIFITIVENTPQVSFSNQIQLLIFNSHCINCHGSFGGLSLAAGMSYNNLVNKPAQSSCGASVTRVLPNNAANSVLYKKVSGNSCGTRMPQGGTLNASDIALIQDWINQGANNN